MNERLAIIFQHDPNIVSRQIAGEVILVPIRNNVADLEYIYTLNETAARAWELTDGKRSMADIAQTIVDEFEVDPSSAEVDLLELADSLVKMGALKKVAG